MKSVKKANLTMSVVIIGDLKPLEYINSTAANDVSPEQGCTVREIKRVRILDPKS